MVCFGTPYVRRLRRRRRRRRRRVRAVVRVVQWSRSRWPDPGPRRSGYRGHPPRRIDAVRQPAGHPVSRATGRAVNGSREQLVVPRRRAAPSSATTWAQRATCCHCPEGIGGVEAGMTGSVAGLAVRASLATVAALDYRTTSYGLPNSRAQSQTRACATPPGHSGGGGVTPRLAQTHAKSDRRPRRWRHDASCLPEASGDDYPKQEAADVREEGDAAAVGVGRGETDVGFDQLIEEPQTEEHPRGNPNRKDQDQSEHAGARYRTK